MIAAQLTLANWFSALLNTDGFVPRWNCGLWSDVHGWTHIISDILIFLAYTSIPVCLVICAVRRRGLPFPRLFLLFAVFIMSCGVTHLIEATLFWWPAYRLSGAMKVMTALASWATVLTLAPILPKALSMPGLQKINDELAREVAQRRAVQAQLAEKTRELEVRNLRLAAKNAELDEFSYVASHDLQEPLRKIIAFGDMAITSAESAPDAVRDCLGRITQAAGRMRTLIDDLLSFSRAGTSAARMRPIPLNRVVSEVLADLEARITETKGSVEVAPLPTIVADATQMRQLLQNLIGNSLKFHRPGQAPRVSVSGRVVANSQASNRLNLDDDAQVCELRIVDNGIGFDAKYAARIFQPFQRLHGRGEYPGSGIGLAVCRRIVERHGGLISADSRADEGSVFTVVLPLEPHGEAANAEPQSEHPEPRPEHAHSVGG